MKRLALVTCLAFPIAACDAPPAAPRAPEPSLAAPTMPSFAVVANERGRFVDEVFNPCNGEPVTITGHFHVVQSGNASKSGNSQIKLHVNAHGEGLGATGARYVFNETQNLHEHQKGTAPIAGHAVLSLKLIRRGSSAVPDNFVVHINVRVIFDPVTGQVIEVVRSRIREECRG